MISAGQKPNQRRDLEAEESTEHVEAGMGEIQHAEHAEDHRQAGSHQEQQHAEQNAVQRGYDDEFEHEGPRDLFDVVRAWCDPLSWPG